jgi:glucose dehydrogenase
MSVDDRRGIVFVPLEARHPDSTGSDGRGPNLYANSLVALEAKSGKLIWYRQLTHHDQWGYDLPPPVLIDVRKAGKVVPAVALAAKTGLLFILERETGKPVYAIQERAVPQGDNPVDPDWPTQPFPVKPPSIARNTITRNEINHDEPEVVTYCENFWDDYHVANNGPYTRPRKDTSTVVFPGSLGGADWGGPSFNPKLGYLFVNVTNLPRLNENTLLSNSSNSNTRADPQREPNTPRGSVLNVNGFTFPKTGTPCWASPWGELVAVQVNTGEIGWRVPLGFAEALGEGGPKTGTFNMGGSIATAGGLVFIAATNDRRFRAFDAKTGEEVWKVTLDASGHATPITYMGRNGKQYVVIAAGGGTAIEGKRVSDSLIAFYLP